MRNNLVDCDAPTTHDDYTQFFRTWLAAEMRRRNVRAEQLARCSLVHRSSISRILSGDRSPTLDTVARLSAAFHIDLALVGPWSGSGEAGGDVARGSSSASMFRPSRGAGVHPSPTIEAAPKPDV